MRHCEQLEAALARKPHRKPREAIFDGAFDARLTALACSQAPDGYQRWTVRLLADKLVELKIVETDPGVRGDTSGGGGKPAKLETGAVVRVPLFVGQEEIIRVDTRSGEYVGRVK